MKKKLFSLCPGDKFLINNKKLEVVRYFMKNMPRIGKTLNLEARDEKGTKSLFISNWEVEVIDNLKK